MRSKLLLLCCLTMAALLSNCEKETFVPEADTKDNLEKCEPCPDRPDLGPGLNDGSCAVGGAWNDESCMEAHSSRTFTISGSNSAFAYWTISDPAKFAFVNGNTGPSVKVEALEPTVDPVFLQVQVGLPGQGIECTSRREICAICPTDGFSLQLAAIPVAGQPCASTLTGSLRPRDYWNDVSSITWTLNGATTTTTSGPTVTIPIEANDNGNTTLSLTAVITLESGCTVTASGSITVDPC